MKTLEQTKWYKTKPNFHTIDETSKMMDLIRDKYNPDRMIVEMRKVNDLGKYVVSIGLKLKVDRK